MIGLSGGESGDLLTLLESSNKSGESGGLHVFLESSNESGESGDLHFLLESSNKSGEQVLFFNNDFGTRASNNTFFVLQPGFVNK